VSVIVGALVEYSTRMLFCRYVEGMAGAAASTGSLQFWRSRHWTYVQMFPIRHSMSWHA